MSSTQERIKQRREYLKKKGWAYTLVGFMVLMAGLCFVGVLGQWQVGSLLGVLSTLFGAWQAIGYTHKVHQQAKQIPYIPPITPDSLPAEEVLVRGSEEPTQEQSKVLLRGTAGSAGTSEQELLRSSQGQNRD